MNIADFVAALPKVELHLQLVGSAAPETVLTLARRHPDGRVPTEPARAGARAAFCPEPTRRAILAEIDQLIPSATRN